MITLPSSISKPVENIIASLKAVPPFGLIDLSLPDKVESVANRLLIFDPKMMHSGSSSTDVKNRIVINLNYFEWDSK